MNSHLAVACITGEGTIGVKQALSFILYVNKFHNYLIRFMILKSKTLKAFFNLQNSLKNAYFDGESSENYARKP